jgi:hypothetical protein
VRIEPAEVQFSCEQEDDGSDGRELTVASGFAFGSLEQAVERFQEAVGLSGLCPGDDALEVVADELRDLFHGRDLGTHDIGAPLDEQRTHDVDLLALQDLAQLFAVEPGTRRALGGDLGKQRIQIDAALGFRRRRSLSSFQRRPLSAGSVFCSMRRVLSMAVEAWAIT